jgi:hypothetical protein
MYINLSLKLLQWCLVNSRCSDIDQDRDPVDKLLAKICIERQINVYKMLHCLQKSMPNSIMQRQMNATDLTQCKPPLQLFLKMPNTPDINETTDNRGYPAFTMQLTLVFLDISHAKFLSLHLQYFSADLSPRNCGFP